MRLESGRLKTYILHTATLKPKNKKGEDRAQTGDIPVGRVSESHTINHPGICFETLIWHSKTSLWHYNYKNKNEGGCDTRDTQVAMVSNLTVPHYRDFFFSPAKVIFLLSNFTRQLGGKSRLYLGNLFSKIFSKLYSPVHYSRRDDYY